MHPPSCTATLHHQRWHSMFVFVCLRVFIGEQFCTFCCYCGPIQKQGIKLSYATDAVSLLILPHIRWPNVFVFVRLFSVCVCFVYWLCLSVYCLCLFLYWQQKSSRLQQLHLPFLYCRLALASSEMTQRVFVCLFKNFICQSLTQSGWKHNRHKNKHSHNVFCACLLICLKFCLFVLCQHSMRIFPPFNLASSEMTQHGVEVKMVIMIRGWSFNLTGTICCFHKEKHKKWWLGEK